VRFSGAEDCRKRSWRGRIQRGMGEGERAVVVPAASYRLDCRACRVLTSLAGPESQFDCTACGRRNFIVACGRCQGAEVIAGARRRKPTGWTCSWCLHQTANVGTARLRARSASAADAWRSLQKHGLTGNDPEVRVLGGFETVAGSGDCPPVGTICSVAALADSVLVVAEIGAHGHTMLPYSDLLELQADGHGILTTGGRYTGGGVGITGALAGMAVASILNNATQKTHIDSYLRLTAHRTEILLRHPRYTPQAIRGALSRIFTGHLAAARTAATPIILTAPAAALAAAPEALPSGPVDELERLTKLHAAGTLTDTEFEMARSKQIKRLHAAEES
jgi:hypothetical protein